MTAYHVSKLKKDLRVTKLRHVRGFAEIVTLATASLLFSELAQAQTDSLASNDPYVFDDNMLFGGGSLSRFNKVNAMEPGQYKVDLFLNGHFVDRVELKFADQGQGDVEPCLPASLLESSGVLASSIDNADNSQCLVLSKVVKGGTTAFDFGQMRLDLSVPQSLMLNTPRGYVAPQNLDAGSTLGFVNYSASQYHVTRTGSYGGHSDSSYLALNSGLNVGMWRFRQQGNLRYDTDAGKHWNTTRTYVQRALPDIKGDMTAGQGFTSGRFFSGLSYTGVEVASDDRMLPESMRGYAPTVRGIAKTNAQVIVRQNGNDIYQTTVAPGPFEISDLYSTSYNGDLQVSVIEADGTVSTFTVPFSAIPESLRPGLSRYSVAVGRTRDLGDHDPFGEMTYQYGLTNSITANSGLRVAEGYQAFVVGGVYAAALAHSAWTQPIQKPTCLEKASWMAGWRVCPIAVPSSRPIPRFRLPATVTPLKVTETSGTCSGFAKRCVITRPGNRRATCNARASRCRSIKASTSMAACLSRVRPRTTAAAVSATPSYKWAGPTP